MSGAVELWGWDTANSIYRKVLVDASGKIIISDADPFTIAQATPQNLKHVPHGYYAAGPSWLPLAVDSAGRQLITLSSLAKLDDIDDVNLTGLLDGDFIVYDSASGTWKRVAHTANPAAHHVRYADAEALAAAWANINTKSFVNLLSNGDFEVGDPPTGWTSALPGAATFSRSTEQVKKGSYSAKIVSDPWAYAYRPIADYLYYRGRKVTAGCWAYATVAERAFITIYDGIGQTGSPRHSGAAGWEWLTVTRTIDGAATEVRYQALVENGATTVYFDGAILVEGDSCPAFAPMWALEALQRAHVGDPTDLPTALTAIASILTTLEAHRMHASV